QSLVVRRGLDPGENKLRIDAGNPQSQTFRVRRTLCVPGHGHLLAICCRSRREILLCRCPYAEPGNFDEIKSTHEIDAQRSCTRTRRKAHSPLPPCPLLGPRYQRCLLAVHTIRRVEDLNKSLVPFGPKA